MTDTDTEVRREIAVRRAKTRLNGAAARLINNALDMYYSSGPVDLYLRRNQDACAEYENAVTELGKAEAS